MLVLTLGALQKPNTWQREGESSRDSHFTFVIHKEGKRMGSRGISMGPSKGMYKPLAVRTMSAEHKALREKSKNREKKQGN